MIDDAAPPVRVVFLDHCAQLSGGELALLRAIPAVPTVNPLVVLFEHGPLESLLDAARIPTRIMEMDARAQDVRRGSATIGFAAMRASWSAARQVVRVRRLLRADQPEVLYLNSLKAFVVGALASYRSGIPVVWHVRDRIATDYLPSIAVRMLRFLARHTVRTIVANSVSTLATVSGLVAHEVVIASPIDPPVRRVPSDGNGPIRVAMVGRLAPWKGQVEFIEALSMSNAVARGSVHVAIAGSALFGEDDYAARVKAAVREHGLGDVVELLGFVDDVPSLLSQCDVLVHCSLIPEPLGQVVAQGMAAGCAVIVPDQGGPAELVTDGVTGLIYPLGDVAALSKAIDRLIDSEADRLALAGSAPSAVSAFTPHAVGLQMQIVLDSLAGRSPMGR